MHDKLKRIGHNKRRIALRIMRVIKTRHTLLIPVLLLCVSQSALTQEDEKQKPLPNFYRVNDVLYRGGQPTVDGLKRLLQLGVKTIVNLRDSDDRAGAEEAVALAAGFRYFNLPLGSFHRPSNERVAEILSVINASENQPVFVHCNRGADRTGTIVAIYRIANEGWTGDQAKEEAKRFGLGFWQVRMKDYVGDYYRHKVERSESVINRKQKQ